MASPADRTEFDRTVLPLLSDCLGFALSLTRHGPDAEDLVQEAFLRAQRSFDAFEPGTNAKAWLFTILRRLHIDKHRRAKIRPSYLPEEELEGMARLKDVEPPPAEAVGGLTGEDVRRALEQVPEPFRIAVRLRDIDGICYKEIGRILGVPPGTVMSRIHRGRECLKGLLVPLPSDGEARRAPAAEPAKDPRTP